ncbi:MAG: RNA methyltransferase [Bacteroidales bacterium]|nr:RNA methyltransferase [Bacteroidales bacterium]
MITKNQIKLINQLKLKKFRDKYQLFIAEGIKIVNDLYDSSFEIQSIFITSEYYEQVNNKFQDIKDINIITDNEIKKISLQKSPNKIFAIVKIPQYDIDYQEIENNLTLVMDNIQDPGNLGTIVRIADWFGIANIVCSENCVDIYNQKVIQATMGSISRIKIHYIDLAIFFENVANNVTVYGTFLEGKNIYEKNFNKNGIVIFGNESKGISDNLHKYISEKIFIPNYPASQKTAESLNISTAAAIICYEFRRKE